MFFIFQLKYEFQRFAKNFDFKLIFEKIFFEILSK